MNTKRVLIAALALLSCAFWLRRWYYVPSLEIGQTHLKIQPNPSETAEQQVDLLVLGDTGSGNEAQFQVARAMDLVCSQLEKPLDGVLLLGDNFYYTGVQSTDDPQWQSKFEKPYNQDCLSKVRFYPVLGNHDYRQDPTPQIAYTAKSSRWVMPARNYQIEFGSLALVAMMDSGYPDFCFNSQMCSVDFAFQAVKKSKATWKIVAAHHPVKTSSRKKYGHQGGVFGWLMSWLHCDQTDLWLSGHAHHLEYRELEGCRLRAAVVGGGGGDLDQVQTQLSPGVKFAESQHGFAHLRIQKESLSVRFYDQHAKILDEFHQSNK